MISLVTIRECKITASGVPLKSVSPVADQFVAVRAHPAGLERVRLFAELMRRGEPFPPIRADAAMACFADLTAATAPPASALLDASVFLNLEVKLACGSLCKRSRKRDG